MLMFVGVSSYAQTMIKGKVMDVKNEPVIGANVVLKATSYGTVVDVNGDFALEIPAGTTDATLIISSIGYITQEIRVGSQTSFNVTLAEDARVLSEVVVTGYTSQRKDKITGAVAIVKADDLMKLPVPTVDQALQGRAPGVVVSQNTGAPGEGVSVRIRGVGSVNSGNSPLYIVDGLPTLDITNLAAGDIESLTILKDASAAAVYGSRAANGVVIITTKTGSNDAPRVQISSQVGFQEPSRKIKMASADQYAQIYNESANADNALIPSDQPFLLRPLITPDIASSMSNIDQVDAIMQRGILQSHSVSVAGGNEKTRYYIGGNYFGQQGIVKSSDYERVSGRVNVDSEVKSWLHAGVNLNISKATSDIVGSSGDGAGGNGGSVLRYAYFRNPAVPIYDANGDFLDKPDRFDLFGDGYNPVGMLAYNQNKKIEDRVFGRVYLNIEPFKGFKIISSLGLDQDNINQRRFDRTWGTNNRINGTNRLKVDAAKNQTITWSNYASYTKEIGEHHLNALLGEETIQGSQYATSSSQTGFSDQDANLTYIGQSTGLIQGSESQVVNTLASFFGKVDYDYANKYLISATIRRDGSSRFGPENRWGTFYAGSLGWRLDQEFFKQSDKVDRWLLRAGYGSIGNQQIVDYGYASRIGFDSYYAYGSTRTAGSSLLTYGNANIKWETSKQINIGTDLEMWSGKLVASFDYFHKLTTDMLVYQPLAASVGSQDRAYTVANNGDMLNTGFELALSHTNHIGAFRYTISVNGATLKNEVKRLDAPIAAGNVGSVNLTLTEQGYPVGSFYLWQMGGIFQNAAEVFTSAKPLGNVQPGDVKYVDQNGDGKIDASDYTHLGSPIPKFTGGLNLSLGYKAFDMSVFFQGAYGQKVYSVLNRDIEGFYRAFNVTERYFQGHWTGEGTSNVYPRASWVGAGNNALISSSRFLENGSYTRLKNLQVGYNVPKEFLERYGFTAFRIFFSGTNLLTFTKFQGSDPEMTTSDNANAKGSGDKAAGIDWGTYPAARSYNLGVNLTF